MPKINNYYLSYLYYSINNILQSQKNKILNIKVNKVSWIKIGNFIKNNENESIIERIIYSFVRFEKSKIPSEKYIFFKEIIDISLIFSCKQKIF
jgi:uncharacterized protein YrrD